MSNVIHLCRRPFHCCSVCSFCMCGEHAWARAADPRQSNMSSGSASSWTTLPSMT